MCIRDRFFIYFFLPLCLIAYALAKKLSAKNTVLIVFSLIFYAWGEPLWILLLLFSSAFNWFIGLQIEKYRETQWAKLAVAGGISLDILLLLIFKYSAFFVQNINGVFGTGIPVPQITLPVSYTHLDVYKRQEYNRAVSFDYRENHIGILNIRQRLHLLYGDRFGFACRNLAPGTEFELIFPLHFEESQRKTDGRPCI